MTSWLIAVAVATALAWYQYGLPRGRATLPAAMRWLAVLLVVALLLGAPAGRRRAPEPIVALDASASWLRGGDSSAWRRAVAKFRAGPSTQLPLLFGDSARSSAATDLPADRMTLTRPLVDRALAAGRPVVVLTDGVIDDPEALPSLPAGSRIEIDSVPAFPDVAALSLDAPRSLVTGDTMEVAVAIGAGSAGADAGALTLRLGERPIGTVRYTALAPNAERRLTLRFAPNGNGPVVLTAMVASPGDREPRNDTLTAVLELTRGAAAVLVSTSPDEDSRFALSVLRGTLALPTRAYLQVAPGAWRLEGPLTSVNVAEVREAVRTAPLVVLHGDTSVFGAPRTLTRGALALIPAITDRGVDWYAVAAPASPLMTPLSQLPWDSLPPLDVAQTLPAGDWVALSVARARLVDRKPAIVGSERPRRTVVVGASGFWRWRFRGGASEPAFSAVWGSIFDWLAAGRLDARAAVPAASSFRSGERIIWQRGTANDSVVRVRLTRRGANAEASEVPLSFAGSATAESSPLEAGIHEVQSPGGRSLIAVNASRELLPRRATVRSGPIGGAATLVDAPLLRDRIWPYVLLLLALCVEWLLRRGVGLR